MSEKGPAFTCSVCNVWNETSVYRLGLSGLKWNQHLQAKFFMSAIGLYRLSLSFDQCLQYRIFYQVWKEPASTVLVCHVCHWISTGLVYHFWNVISIYRLGLSCLTWDEHRQAWFVMGPMSTDLVWHVWHGTCVDRLGLSWDQCLQAWFDMYEMDLCWQAWFVKQCKMFVMGQYLQAWSVMLEYTQLSFYLRIWEQHKLESKSVGKSFTYQIDMYTKSHFHSSFTNVSSNKMQFYQHWKFQRKKKAGMVFIIMHGKLSTGCFPPNID